jgi:hypothetical protein
MGYLKKILGLLSIALIALSAKSQYVTIPDTAFANAIKERFPDIITGHSLDTVLAATKNMSFSVTNRGTIENLEGLQYFKSLNTFNASHNKISHVPNISNNKLVSLNLSNNNIKNLPSLANLPNLTNLYIGSNSIEKIVGIESLVNLKIFIAGNNQITELPDFSALQNLENVGLRNNLLPWEQIISITHYKNFNSVFYVFPQLELTPKDTLYLTEGDKFELVYPFDQNIPGLRYTFQKNNSINFLISDTNTYTIEAVSLNDAGIYEVFAEVTHIPEWENIRLVTGEVRVNVSPCQEVYDYYVSYAENCPHGTISIDSLSLLHSNVNLYIEHAGNKTLLPITYKADYSINKGIYNLVISRNTSQCIRTIDSVFNVGNSELCLLCDSMRNIHTSNTLIQAIEHGSITLDYPCFPKNTGNVTYTWFWNDYEITRTQSPWLYFPQLTMQNKGIYHVLVSCTTQNNTLKFLTENIVVDIAAYNEIKNIMWEQNVSCEKSTVTLKEISQTNNTISLHYTLENIVDTTIIYNLIVGEPIDIMPGIYNLSITDNMYFYKNILKALQ